MNPESPLKPAEQKQLLAIARRSLTAFLQAESSTAPDSGNGSQPIEKHTSAGPADEEDLPAALLQPAGAFVTLHLNGRLRGCIGALNAGPPLARLAGDLAVAAGTRDPRFEPVTLEELAALDFEISVLTSPVPVTRLAQIESGRHGLIVGRGPSRGVLLPQVAIENGWDSATFLSQTCVKAGLAEDAWKAWEAGSDDHFQVKVFSAQVFGEHPR